MISFGSAGMLVGLALCALPALIHLLHRRRRRVVTWALMDLLARARAEQPRSTLLHDRLLLAVRTLLVACLVLAFARPVLHLGRGGLASGALPGRTVIVIDGSASMGRASEGATLFERAQAATLAELDAHPLASVSAYLAAGRVIALGDTREVGRAELEGAIRAAQTSAEPASLVGALAELERYGALIDADRVLLATDLQAVSFADRTSSTSRALRSIGARAPITLLAVEPARATENLALTALTCAHGRLVDLEAPAQFTLELENDGPARTARVQVRVDGALLRTVELALPPHGRLRDHFTCTFDAPGVHAVEAELEPDDFPLDDRRALCVEAPAAIPVLCLADERTVADEPADEPTRFLRAFLTPPAARGAALFDARLAIFDELARLDERGPALLVVSDATPLDAARVATLEARVAAGTPLLIFAGPRTESALYDAELDRGGRGLLPLALLAPEGVDFDELTSFEAALALDLPTARHPAFATHASPQRWWAALGSLFVSKRFRVAEDPARAAEVALRLDDGSPLVVERAFGRGRVALVTIPCDPRWSNLPTSAALALLDRVARHLVEPRLGQRNAFVGDELAFEVERTESARGGLWRAPDGSEEPARWDEQRGALVLARAEQAGVHELASAGGGGGRFAVRFDARESRLAPASLEELARLHPGVPFELHGAPLGELAPARAVQLAPAFLALAILALLVESWLTARGASAPVPQPAGAR